MPGVSPATARMIWGTDGDEVTHRQSVTEAEPAWKVGVKKGAAPLINQPPLQRNGLIFSSPVHPLRLQVLQVARSLYRVHHRPDRPLPRPKARQFAPAHQ